MCGIWASVGLKVGSDRMTRVAHRGPDGAGWRDFDGHAGPVSLGHRRLAIIDTSEDGLQPMTEAQERYWLTFNGEIYNFVELRHELEAAGVTFRSRSDSEVLLQALVHWGMAALPRLLGMFAFAFWDEEAKILLVARDRFGIKPLCFAETDRGIAFASEIKQLHDLPGVSRRMNLPRVHDFLKYGILDHTAATMFAGVRQLRGGEAVRIDCRRWRPGMPLPVERWYTLPRAGSLALDLATAAERYRDLFVDAIKLHLRSDVHLGSCLSGGLDSSTIVGEASRQLGPAHPMTTVSAAFTEARVNERRYMEAVIARTGARPRFVSFGAERVFETAERVIWHQDEPFGSTSILAQWFVFEEAGRAGVKVMLDGQGADEPLAGYHWMFGAALADHLRCGRWASALQQVRGRQRVSGVMAGEQLRAAAAYLAPFSLRELVRRRGRSAGGRDWLAGRAFQAIEPSPDPFGTSRGGPWRGGALEHLIESMTTTTSVPMLLHWEDRNSMAHGIEARVPFLDHRLVELAVQLGARHKIVGAETKVLLRRAMGHVLPQEVLQRHDKLGFATPEQEWLMGPLAAPLRDAVMQTLDSYPELLDRDGTMTLVDDTLAGRRPADFTLWRIACVGLWGRRFGMMT